MESIKAGDIVYIKSNPEIHLTISDVYDDGQAKAIFYNTVKEEFQYVTSSIHSFVKINE